MKKRTRFILFSTFIVIYLILSPLIIFYSLGYRFDFTQMKIVSTGGLYLKIWPGDAQINIDGKIDKKTGVFSNEALIQGLFPKKYNIIIKKDGHSAWEKNLEIKDRQVTSVDNVTLIKENILFEKIKDNIKSFYLSPNRDLILLIDSTEYSFSINDTQTMAEKNSFLLPESTEKNVGVVSWDENLKIIMLEANNNYFLIDYNKLGVIKPKTTSFESTNDLVSGGKLTFKKVDGYIYLLDKETNKFSGFYQAKDIIFSPDESKFLFFNNYEILFAKTDNPDDKNFLLRFSEKINNCFWLNNNYLIFDVAGNIKISEIDNRDKINTVALPQQISLKGNSTITLNNPKMFFDEINKNLYLLNNKILLISERLTDKNNK
ncbi:hypothetical protein KJ786_01970 [Patescibacteria group bacterium]|nr:hypothetical protein [Patescibacteria group bacterium]